MKIGRNIIFAMVTVWLLGSCALEEEVMLADGRATQFSHWEGRWMLVNYWAGWCAPSTNLSAAVARCAENAPANAEVDDHHGRIAKKVDQRHSLR